MGNPSVISSVIYERISRSDLYCLVYELEIYGEKFAAVTFAPGTASIEYFAEPGVDELYALVMKYLEAMVYVGAKSDPWLYNTACNIAMEYATELIVGEFVLTQTMPIGHAVYAQFGKAVFKAR